MIKLESKTSLPSAVSVLEIRSHDIPAISVTTEEYREVSGTTWEKSKDKVKQQVGFVGADGTPCTLEGVVSEPLAVEMAAAYKVVCLVRVVNDLKAAFAAGRVSKGYTALELVGVAEVWSDAKTCVYRAETGNGKAPGTAVNMDSVKIGNPTKQGAAA